MLASTVQFSNNDQKVQTAHTARSLRTQQRARHTPATLIAFHAPKRSTSQGVLDACRIVNVPPMSEHSKTFASSCYVLHRKEVIQPHLPVRLPCYDFTPIADPTFDSSLPKGWATGFGRYQLSWCDGRCVQGPGTYSPQHADLRLLATPTSWGRVADPNPN